MLFDLDGTLSDSLADIAWALRTARVEMGYAPVTDEEVRGWVGAGAPLLVARSLGVPETDPRVAPLLARFLDVYTGALPADGATLYPGVVELLDGLRARGVLVACTTNKPEGPARALLAGLGILDRFDALVTPESAGTRKPDGRFMEAALARLGVAAAEALVVGDGNPDLEAARAAGIRCVAVLGGYGSRDELLSLEPEFTVETVSELAGRWT